MDLQAFEFEKLPMELRELVIRYALQRYFDEVIRPGPCISASTTSLMTCEMDTTARVSFPLIVSKNWCRLSLQTLCRYFPISIKYDATTTQFLSPFSETAASFIQRCSLYIEPSKPAEIEPWWTKKTSQFILSVIHQFKNLCQLNLFITHRLSERNHQTTLLENARNGLKDVLENVYSDMETRAMCMDVTIFLQGPRIYRSLIFEIDGQEGLNSMILSRR
jgi:hypothetical protein